MTKINQIIYPRFFKIQSKKANRPQLLRIRKRFCNIGIVLPENHASALNFFCIIALFHKLLAHCAQHTVLLTEDRSAGCSVRSKLSSKKVALG